jgi:fatty acyl-CoA reductase
MGFIGKVMVEKLLRSCPGIENIYLLARAKKDKSMDERLAEIIKSPVFNNLQKINPDVVKKISLIEGDISLLELGISNENQKLLSEKVAIVLHAAATISFKEPMRVAIETNVRSIREMMKLCRQMKKLEVN